MNIFYLANKHGSVEKHEFLSAADAFRAAQNRNRKPQRTDVEWHDENWKAYDERGNLICGFYIDKGVETK